MDIYHTILVGVILVLLYLMWQMFLDQWKEIDALKTQVGSLEKTQKEHGQKMRTGFDEILRQIESLREPIDSAAKAVETAKEKLKHATMAATATKNSLFAKTNDKPETPPTTPSNKPSAGTTVGASTVAAAATGNPSAEDKTGNVSNATCNESTATGNVAVKMQSENEVGSSGQSKQERSFKQIFGAGLVEENKRSAK